MSLYFELICCGLAILPNHFFLMLTCILPEMSVFSISSFLEALPYRRLFLEIFLLQDLPAGWMGIGDLEEFALSLPPQILSSSSFGIALWRQFLPLFSLPLHSALTNFFQIHFLHSSGCQPGSTVVFQLSLNAIQPGGILPQVFPSWQDVPPSSA